MPVHWQSALRELGPRPCDRLPLLSAKSTVTLPYAQRHHILDCNILYCSLVTEALPINMISTASLGGKSRKLTFASLERQTWLAGQRSGTRTSIEMHFVLPHNLCNVSL